MGIALIVILVIVVLAIGVGPRFRRPGRIARRTTRRMIRRRRW